MTNFTESRRDTCDAAKLGRLALAESFRTLHSTVQSDVAVMSRVGSGWPAFLQDEVGDLEPSKRWYSPAQIRRAEALCASFMHIPVTHEAKKDAVHHALSTSSWKKIARGRDWRAVRSAVESVYVRLAYVLADLEGIKIGRPELVSG